MDFENSEILKVRFFKYQDTVLARAITAIPAVLRSTTQAHKVCFVVADPLPILLEAVKHIFMNVSRYFLAVLNKLCEKLSHMNLDHYNEIVKKNQICEAFVGQRYRSADLIINILIQ